MRRGGICARRLLTDEQILIRRTGPTAPRHQHDRPCSPSFGEDVPVPGAGSALLLLGQRQKLEAGEECGKSGQVAIILWVRLGLTAANEGVRCARPAAPE